MRQTVDYHQRNGFFFGTFDCGILFGDVDKAMTGEDPLKGIRGYKTPAGALKKLKAKGYNSVLELVEDKYKEISPGIAGRGDFVYCQLDDDPLRSPAVVMGAVVVSRDENSWQQVPRIDIKRAFKVG